MNTPLGIINIKYLLSTKSLLQSLNLVHLQLLEQRTDLEIKWFDKREQKGRNSKNDMQYFKGLRVCIQLKASVAGKYNLEAPCSSLNKEDYASKWITMYEKFGFAEFSIMIGALQCTITLMTKGVIYQISCPHMSVVYGTLVWHYVSVVCCSLPGDLSHESW